MPNIGDERMAAEIMMVQHRAGMTAEESERDAVVRRRARRVVRAHARDDDDAQVLLDALGLLPDDDAELERT